MKDCDLGSFIYEISSGTLTIDLNGMTLTGTIQLGGGHLTIKGTPGSKMHGKIVYKGTSGSLTIDGGYYYNDQDPQSFLMVTGTGELSIIAGEFVGGGNCALNISSTAVDENNQSLQRNVTGGTFHGISDAHSQETRCRPDGYCFNVGDQKLKLEDVHANGTATLTIKQCTAHDYENGKSCIYCGLANPIPADAVAKVGDTYYTNLTEALDAAATTGKPVTLLQNAMPEGDGALYTQSAGTTLTINLNGYTLLKASDGRGGILMPKSKEATLNVNGPGKVEGTIWCNEDNSLTIQGGSYGEIRAKNVTALNISGAEVNYLNVEAPSDGNGAYKRLNVTSGTIHSAWGCPNVMYCLAAGYCFRDADGKAVDLSGVTNTLGDTEAYTTAYTVAPCIKHSFVSDPTQEKCVYCDTLNSNNPAAGMVAMVGQTYYGTVEEAVAVVAAAGSGTVKIVRNCKLQKSITINSNVTIDLNGKHVQTESGMSFEIMGGNVAIASSTGTGRISGTRCSAILLSGGMLSVDSGVILEGAGGDIYRAVYIDGGKLILNQGVILIYGIKTSTSVDGIYAYLAGGTAFAEYDSATAAGSLVNGYTTKDYSGDLIVVEHTVHNYNDIGECPCGYICPHTKWDENGVCTVCEKTAAAVLTVNGKAEFFMDATAALDKAQQSTGEVTLKLLKDVRFNGGTYSVTSGTFTVDLNGYALGNGATGDTEINGANVTVVSSAERAIGRYSDFYINSGKLTFNLSNTFNIGHLSVQGGEVTISGGNFYDTTGVNLYGGTVRISGGVFEQTYINNNADVKISGGTFRELRLEDGRTLKDILAKNKAFAREDGTELALTLTEFMEWNNVTVRDHVHNMENNKCTICGFECNHVDGNVDCGDAITGKCTKCGALIYGASLQQGGGFCEGL